MINLVFRLLGSMLVGTCFFSLSLVFFCLADLIRLFPRLLTLLRISLRGVLILSFRFYHLVFRMIAPFVHQHLGIDIMIGYVRLVASILLSIVLSLLLVLLINLPISGWTMGISLLHGLLVGLAWDEIAEPGGLQLGVNAE